MRSDLKNFGNFPKIRDIEMIDLRFHFQDFAIIMYKKNEIVDFGVEFPFCFPFVQLRFREPVGCVLSASALAVVKLANLKILDFRS